MHIKPSKFHLEIVNNNTNNNHEEDEQEDNILSTEQVPTDVTFNKISINLKNVNLESDRAYV